MVYAGSWVRINERSDTVPERIYTSAKAGSLEALEETPFSSEDELQALIAEHPELIDGEQIRPGDARRWILITREKGIAASAGGGRAMGSRPSDRGSGCRADARGGQARLQFGGATDHRRTAVGVRGARIGDMVGRRTARGVRT